MVLPALRLDRLVAVLIVKARIDVELAGARRQRGEWRGIFRLSGDSLEIVDNAYDMAKPRPTLFTTQPGSGYVLVQFMSKSAVEPA